jgi:hypothetical protein
MKELELDSLHSSDYFGQKIISAQMGFLENFAAENPAAYRAYQERLLLENQTEQELSRLTNRADASRQVFDRLLAELEGFSKLDLARSIFENCRSTGRRAHAVAAEILSSVVLNDHAKEILSLARKDWESAAAELAAFQKKHAVLLGEVESKRANQIAARQRKIDAEQDQAFARRAGGES